MINYQIWSNDRRFSDSAPLGSITEILDLIVRVDLALEVQLEEVWVAEDHIPPAEV